MEVVISSVTRKTMNTLNMSGMVIDFDLLPIIFKDFHAPKPQTIQQLSFRLDQNLRYALWLLQNVNWKNPEISNRINDADRYVQTKARISPTNNSFFINTFYEALSSE